MLNIPLGCSMLSGCAPLWSIYPKLEVRLRVEGVGGAPVEKLQSVSWGIPPRRGVASGVALDVLGEPRVPRVC